MLRKSKMKRRNTEPSLAGPDGPGGPGSGSSSDRRKDRDREEKSSITENE